MNDLDYLHQAWLQAKKSYDEGGVPVGAVMVDALGEVIAAGHNRRVQHDDCVSHGETDCLRQAGLRDDYEGVTLYTTLSPCMMCTGAVLHFGIRRVVIGEDQNAQCKSLMSQFISERPDIWFEDIAGNETT